MSTSLHTALLEDFGIQSRDELAGQHQIWFDYAASSNQRGEELIEKLESQFTGPLRGKRVLDIGCGFGGCMLAAAKRGAIVTGVDLSERNIRLATRNLQDVVGGEIALLPFDITRPDAVATLGNFDLVIADNVIEHVRSPAMFIANASTLMKPSGYFYVTAPNARSVDMVRAECHYSLMGASLLSPHQAQELLRATSGNPHVDYEVSFYLDFNQYVLTFARYGLTASSLLPEIASEQEFDQLKADVERMVADLCTRDWPVMGAEIREAAMRWQDEFNADLQVMPLDRFAFNRSGLASRVLRDYRTGLWYFMARKGAEPPVPWTLGRIARGVRRRLRA